MAKKNRMGKSSYTSKGERNSVATGTRRAMRAAYMESGDRIINQLKAVRAGKNVMVTIPNPNPNETNKPFIRVNGRDWFAPASKEEGETWAKEAKRARR